MALSDSQKISLFQVLEVPLFDTIGLLHGESNLNQQPFNSGTSDFQAKAAIESHLDNLAANYTGYEDELKTYLDEWSALGSQTLTLDGSVGGIDGVSINTESERLEIRRRVLVIVPFYRAHEEMMRSNEQNTSINVIR